MDETLLRQQLKNLLLTSEAHMTLSDALQHFPEKDYNTVFPNGKYTFWHLLEHMRISQHDILEFITNPTYQEMEWPTDYWPEKDQQATKKEWEQSIHEYKEDLKKISDLVMNPAIQLTQTVGNETDKNQTYFREFLLVADHTAYHTGEFAIMRQVMDNWQR